MFISFPPPNHQKMDFGKLFELRSSQYRLCWI